jgi:hypothetical protein
MKKIILLIALLPIFNINAQFTLTINGLVNSDDETKNYVVYEFDGISQSELYKRVLMFINKTYNSPKDVVSEVQYDLITISGVQHDQIGVGVRKSKLDTKLMGKYTRILDLHYKLNIEFKDSKIRINSPTFDCYKIISGGKKSRLNLTDKGGFMSDDFRIFNLKKGEVEEKDAKKLIESFFNYICLSIKASIDAKEKDEW